MAQPFCDVRVGMRGDRLQEFHEEEMNLSKFGITLFWF